MSKLFWIIIGALVLIIAALSEGKNELQKQLYECESFQQSAIDSIKGGNHD